MINPTFAPPVAGLFFSLGFWSLQRARSKEMAPTRLGVRSGPLEGTGVVQGAAPVALLSISALRLVNARAAWRVLGPERPKARRSRS
jgi:hypothetical protein